MDVTDNVAISGTGPGIRLVAIDLDDTLLTDALVIPPGARAAIQAAQEAGVHVVIATGRMFPAAKPYAQQLGLKTPLITYNGAMVRTVAGETLRHRPVPRALALEVLDYAGAHGWAVQCYFDDRLYVPEMDEGVLYYTRLAGVPAYVAKDMRALVHETEPTKMLAVGTPQETTARAQGLEARFGSRLAVTISKPRFVEMLEPRVSKASALAEVAAHLGVAREETLAIGDSFNDAEMLTWAGIGVAMGNGHPDVRRLADYVVASNAEEGVAEALHRFVLG